jgi:leucyl aminopeptidase
MPEIVAGPDVAECEGDLLVVPVMEDLTMGPGADWVVDQLDWVQDYLAGGDFTGKRGQLASVPGAGAIGFRQVLFVGLGDEVDAEGLRRAGAIAAGAAKPHAKVVTTLHQVDLERAEDLVAFGFELGQYVYTRYLTEPPTIATERVVLAGTDEDGSKGAVVARAVVRARDLGNEPAAGKSPSVLAEWATETFAGTDVTVTVWGPEEIAAERLGGLAAVAAGSHEEARLVRLHHAPPGATRKLVLVGKGIVFDSGGLSLKSPASMEEMKSDMSGAAAVFGAMWAISQLDLPVEVIGITPLTENMPGGAALRPGDVFTARNGKTVEVLNTDAEGRLVLADGLSLAVEEQPDLVVDIATLTGGCMVALGKKVAGLFASDDDVAATVTAAADMAGEAFWRLPLESEYRSNLESTVADIKNVADRFGSAITAALFLAEFAGDGPWAHLDIAGPARAPTAEHYITKGCTGFGVRTLVALAESLAD